jgi:preprotein translocase subunit SecG
MQKALIFMLPIIIVCLVFVVIYHVGKQTGKEERMGKENILVTPKISLHR